MEFLLFTSISCNLIGTLLLAALFMLNTDVRTKRNQEKIMRKIGLPGTRVLLINGKVVEIQRYSGDEVHYEAQSMKYEASHLSHIKGSFSCAMNIFAEQIFCNNEAEIEDQKKVLVELNGNKTELNVSKIPEKTPSKISDLMYRRISS